MNNEKPVLLFDLGGVIMDIEKENCIATLRRFGMTNPEAFLGDYGQKGPFLKIEEGAITPEEFYDELRQLFPAGSTVTNEQLKTAFNDFLTGIPVERLRRLEQLHKEYRIFMLSNTNPIMWYSKIDAEFRKDGHDRDYYFDGCLTSFEAHCCKPADKIFLDVLSKFNLKASEVVFFDDSKANCEAAERLGFRTVWVAPGSEFYNLIPE
jgi:putative hydrolase of the HAD superfamily